MLKRLDHIGIVVENIQQACQAYAGLGMKVSHMLDLPTKSVTVAFLPMGDMELELLQPNATGSNIADFLKENGEGLHHICFEVTDLDATLQSVREAGLILIDEVPRQGATGRIAFINSESTNGVLIELMEKTR
ncbi:MAG: methylmalonyl-CoA epimerase [Chloroflexi bacterium GWB2_49_20]|nr:MAG: methylmalonyl-CoA epimerase [Chloroflexi bacterium GWB2_49_20]OGN76825.1 MAG: methylmalonyl-CoA epimerase [Chloroflexi bacterium GWC2_49_37]OGN84345.1 MAG: methylmalonyl-CoA epimerase [Chloroflexi bacterium GWD2_49_16]HCC78275.1 methylmalonyl-CoA epimerase [Anaerolineae bacterium]HCM96690.1 methylmalonyl-CoA epimerase [Anaerolineae bacterium]